MRLALKARHTEAAKRLGDRAWGFNRQKPQALSLYRFTAFNPLVRCVCNEMTNFCKIRYKQKIFFHFILIVP